MSIRDNERMRKRYARLVVQCKCPICKIEDDRTRNGYTYCERHAEMYREYQRKRKEKQKGTR